MDIQEVQRDFEAQGYEWEFNPPKASHFGGVWETKIGKVRKALEASLLLAGPRKLTRDEFYTFIQEAAAVVNSSPLWEVSQDPNDPRPLSPASLMTLKDDASPPPLHGFSESDLLAYGGRRWRRVQYLADQFWIRWRQSYLQELQKRVKWHRKSRNVEVGDIVLLRDKGVARSEWPFGLIEEACKSNDGLVRKVKVKVIKLKNGSSKSFIYDRPISEIVLLVPNQDSYNNVA